MLLPFIIFFSGLLLLIPGFCHAVCPICTFAVGAGIGLAQYLHIDDTITGSWIGGMLASMIIWTIDWLNNKNIRFYGRKILISFIYYASVIIPLYLKGIIGHELNTFFGYDRLLLGIMVGTIIFILANLSDQQLKKHHNNKTYFPFQKVVIPLAGLIILSIIFYLLIN